jgi:hypothetical protein
MINIRPLNNINCKNCKALLIKPDEYNSKINYWRTLQLDFIRTIKSIKLYILLPYLSPDRFFYDTKTDAWHRNDLKRILLKDSTDDNFIKHLNNRGIVIVECCFCPLHRLFLNSDPFSDVSSIMTDCFIRHNLQLLEICKTAPIITLFEESFTISEEKLPDINTRIIKNYELYKLERSNKRFINLVESITSISEL